MNRKYRKCIIAANWKMNKTPTEAKEFAKQFKLIAPKGRWCDIIVCAPAITIPAAVRAFKETRVTVGGQNVYWKQSGAYTGEISTDMLVDAGAECVIIGHSERRSVEETDYSVNLKTAAAIKAGLTPIICVGESLQQRDLGVAFDIISTQVKMAVAGLTKPQMRKVIFAYEPLWAIGTGVNATPEQAEEICEHIRATIRKAFDARVARAISILYGGSMNPSNAAELLAMPDVDGGLIGGAALDPEKFVNIIKAANQPSAKE
ncbi:MAG: triose-phosphate isomerase [Oscillospiraceae bacterium]|nr:triose-phosphate isomerase [Oscillospiraceae bacterium]